MSTLNVSQAGELLAPHVAVTEEEESLLPPVAFIPRSTLNNDTMSSSLTSGAVNASVQSDLLGYRNLNIEFPACNQSSLSMELTHDGKVTALVARFESYANYSDEAKEPHNQHPCATSMVTHCPSNSESKTVQGADDEYTHTIGDDGQEQQSPRKPIPAQWLPKSHGPNLATARRAKERSHKTEAHGLGPTVMTIRGSRSSLEMGKYGTENTIFLTKEALAAVENNPTTTTSHSPSRVNQSSSKQSRSSPNVSPQRNSTRQYSKFTIKMSPTRKTFLSADLTPSGHSRAPSSVTTSVGGNSFHTAEGSPVRSSAGSDVSFETAAEILEEMNVGNRGINANSEIVQSAQSPKKGHMSPLKAATELRSSAVKPRLSPAIPPSPSSESDDQAASVLNSITSNSITTITPSNQSFPGQTSRIPRVSATSKTGSARGATRSSTLKRVQSIKSLSPKTKAPEDNSVGSNSSKLPNTSTSGPPRYIRTVDSSGTTPILSCTFLVNDITYLHSAGYVPPTDNSVVQTKSSELEEPITNDHATASAGSSTREDVTVSKKHSRATSNATVNASFSSQDAVLGMKSDVSGTPVTCPSNIMKPIVMMAHIFDIGTSNEGKSGRATSVIDNTSPVRGRTEQYLPSVRKQAESQHSMHSSLGSDLRATAPEFVPKVRTIQYLDNAPVDPIAVSRLEPGTDLDMFGFDKHGIPWAYYMYPIQFAYDQGFRNGRSKSPRKFKQRKQRSLVSSSTDIQNQSQRASFPATDIRLESNTSFPVIQRQSDAILMPPPPIPAFRFRGPTKGENSHRSLTAQQYAKSEAEVDEKTGTFAPQANIDAQQPTLSEFRTRNTPQRASFGPTATYTVPFLSGSRDIKTPHYNNVSYRGPHHNRRNAGNGLYSGRGAAGVPMDVIFPFPDPMPPQGRPDQGRIHQGSPQQYVEYKMGTEACGMVDIGIAAERGGGEACNACTPDH